MKINVISRIISPKMRMNESSIEFLQLQVMSSVCRNHLFYKATRDQKPLQKYDYDDGNND